MNKKLITIAIIGILIVIITSGCLENNKECNTQEILSSHIIIYGESFAGPLYTKEVNITLNEDQYFMTYLCKNFSYLYTCDCKNVEKNINETTIKTYSNFINTIIDEGESAKCCDHPWTELEIIYKDGSKKFFILSHEIDLENIFNINCL